MFFKFVVAHERLEQFGILPFWLKLFMATAIVFPTLHPCTFAMAKVHNRSVGILGRVWPEEITSSRCLQIEKL
jgi:hypothetical protein